MSTPNEIFVSSALTRRTHIARQTTRTFAEIIEFQFGILYLVWRTNIWVQLLTKCQNLNSSLDKHSPRSLLSSVFTSVLQNVRHNMFISIHNWFFKFYFLHRVIGFIYLHFATYRKLSLFYSLSRFKAQFWRRKQYILCERWKEFWTSWNRKIQLFHQVLV